jgi:hypothetical protein
VILSFAPASCHGIKSHIQAGKNDVSNNFATDLKRMTTPPLMVQTDFNPRAFPPPGFFLLL